MGGVRASASFPATMRNSRRASPPAPRTVSADVTTTGCRGGQPLMMPGGGIEHEAARQAPRCEAQRPRSRRGHTEQEGTSGSGAGDACAMDVGGRCDSRRARLPGRLRLAACTAPGADFAPAPARIVAPAHATSSSLLVSPPSSTSSVRTRAPVRSADSFFGGIAGSHQAAFGDLGVVGPHLECHRTDALADRVVEAHHRFEARGVALEVDDEFADRTSADAVRRSGGHRARWADREWCARRAERPRRCDMRLISISVDPDRARRRLVGAQASSPARGRRVSPHQHAAAPASANPPRVAAAPRVPWVVAGAVGEDSG